MPYRSSSGSSAQGETDLLVLGGGPAGGTAALFAARIGRSVRVIGGNPGFSLIYSARRIDNYPGLDGIAGADFLDTLQQQAISAGVSWVPAHAVSLEIENRRKQVRDDQGRLWSAHSVIIATGTEPLRPSIPGLDRLWGKGVSLCAWCDGSFFQGKRVAVLGGGNGAFTSAQLLERIAAEVHLLLPKRSGNAFATLRRQALESPRVRMHHDAEILECQGEQRLTGLRVRIDGDIRQLPLDALFISIGQTPRTAFLPASIPRNADGFLRADAQGKTDLPGVFAAGDVVEGVFRQLITACGSGATAALAAETYLSRQWSDPTHD